MVVSPCAAGAERHLGAGTMENGRRNQRQRKHLFSSCGVPKEGPVTDLLESQASRNSKLRGELTFPFYGPPVPNILFYLKSGCTPSAEMSAFSVESELLRRKET